MDQSQQQQRADEAEAPAAERTPAMPAGFREILDEQERRRAAFERVTDVSARARELLAAADRAEAAVAASTRRAAA